MNEHDNYEPFAHIKQVNPAYLLHFIQQEHPQTIALILSYLESNKAAFILKNIPHEIQSDVTRRIATMDSTSQEVLREMELVLEKKLSPILIEDYSSAGGVKNVVEILNHVEHSLKKQIIEDLEKKDPELAEVIETRILVKLWKKIRKKVIRIIHSKRKRKIVNPKPECPIEEMKKIDLRTIAPESLDNLDLGDLDLPEEPNDDKNTAKKERKRTEILSQEEIDQLLTAINAGDTDINDFKPVVNMRKVKMYDFKRPDKFSREQIRTISMIHETFARLTNASLFAQLRSMVQIHVASVDQLTYDEFLRSIPTPTTVAVINMDPLQGNVMLEIDPATTFSIIDRLFGGIGDGMKDQHELTDIEQSLMEGIIVRILGNMREAWSQVIDLRPRLCTIDTNPHFAQIVPPVDMVVLITLETKIGDVEGMINFCVPYITVEPIMGKLSTQYWFSKIDRKTTRENIDVLKAKLERVYLGVSAEYFTINRTIKEVSEFKIGMVLLAHESHIPYTGDIIIGRKIIGKFKLANVLKTKVTVEITEIQYSFKERYMGEKNKAQYQDTALDDVYVEVTCELGRTRKTIGEVKQCREGTILELDKLSGEPVDVLVNSVLIAKGEVVVIDENFGIRLTEIVSPSQRDTTEEEIQNDIQTDK